MKLRVEGALMRQNALVVKAFEGSRRVVIGKINLPILIGCQIFEIISMSWILISPL